MSRQKTRHFAFLTIVSRMSRFFENVSAFLKMSRFSETFQKCLGVANETIGRFSKCLAIVSIYRDNRETFSKNETLSRHGHSQSDSRGRRAGRTTAPRASSLLHNTIHHVCSYTVQHPQPASHARPPREARENRMSNTPKM